MSAIWSLHNLWVPAGLGAPGVVACTRAPSAPARSMLSDSAQCMGHPDALGPNRQRSAHRASGSTPSLDLGQLGHARAISLLLMYIIYLAGRTLFYASAAYF